MVTGIMQGTRHLSISAKAYNCLFMLSAECAIITPANSKPPLLHSTKEGCRQGVRQALPRPALSPSGHPLSRFPSIFGLGLFAGLNALPKPTYMCSYSCRTEASAVLGFQHKISGRMQSSYPELYNGKTINLDFHSIPHFGEESEMERVSGYNRGK